MRIGLGYQTSLWKASDLRFRESGPAIPDELLVARDEGQVLFFCGAGVSSDPHVNNVELGKRGR